MRPAPRLIPLAALPVVTAAAVLAVGCGGGADAGAGASPAPTAGAADTAAAGPTATVGTAYPVSYALTVSDTAPGWQQRVTAVGRVTGLTDRPRATLQFRAASGGGWRTADRAALSPSGVYRFRFRPPENGSLRMALAPAAGVDPPARVSPAQRLDVHAAISFDTLRLTHKAGQPVVIAGRVEPLRAGRKVVAQAYTGGRWQPVTSVATGAGGGYRLSWKPRDDLSVRVVAAGDGQTAAVTQPVGYVESKIDGSFLTPTGPMRTALASRFDDYGLPLACGGLLGRHQQGVAHKTLPCGTLVTITYHGRTVRVPVIDRGPYIEPREFDLTGATADTLGFEGVHTIRVSP